MRIRTTHAPYIANKITLDLLNSGFVQMKQGIDPIRAACLKVIDADIDLEFDVDDKVRKLLDKNEEDIEFYSPDRKQLFWMVKRKVAVEMGLILEQEERFNSMAHKVLDEIWNDDLADYNVTETRIKTVIVKAMLDFVKSQDAIEEAVKEKVRNYKRNLTEGSEEYEIVVQKLYEDELTKRGML
jgi:uncharacterized protein